MHGCDEDEPNVVREMLDAAKAWAKADRELARLRAGEHSRAAINRAMDDEEDALKALKDAVRRCL